MAVSDELRLQELLAESNRLGETIDFNEPLSTGVAELAPAGDALRLQELLDVTPDPNQFADPADVDVNDLEFVEKIEFDTGLPLSSILPNLQNLRTNDIVIGEISFTEALVDSLTKEKLPFVGSLYKAERISKIIAAAQRLGQPDGTIFGGGFVPAAQFPSPVSVNIPGRNVDETRDADKKLISDWVFALEERQRRGITLGGRFAEAVTELPAFVVEFILTGPLFKAGSAATKTAAIKILGRVAEHGVGKVAVRAAAAAFGSVLRTSVNVPRIMSGAVERMTKGIQITEDGAVSFSNAEAEPFTSIVSSLGDLFIENLSEVSGAALREGVLKGAGAIAKRFPILDDLAQKIGEKWIANRAGRTLSQFAKASATRIGFDGILEEIGEERLGAIMRAVTGLGTFDEIIPSQEELLIEAGVFSLLGGLSLAKNQIFRRAGIPIPVQRTTPLDAAKEIEAAVTPTEPIVAPEAVQKPTEGKAIKTPEDVAALSNEEFNRRIASLNKEIPLGGSRQEVVDATLADLSFDEFNEHQSQIKQELDVIEKQFDDDLSLEFNKDFRRKMAAKQDEFSAVENEEFRRKIEDDEVEFLAFEFGQLNLSNDKGKVRGLLLAQEIKNQGVENEFKAELAKLSDMGADERTVMRGQLEDFAKLIKQESIPAKPALTQPPTPKAEEPSALSKKLAPPKTKAIVGSMAAAAVKPFKTFANFTARSVARAEDIVGTWGTAGKRVQAAFRHISARSAKNSGNSTATIKNALKGLSDAEKVDVSKIVDGLGGDWPFRLRRRADIIKAELDKMQQEAINVGLRKTTKGGPKEVGKVLTGRAFPQVPNAKGKAFLEEAETKGKNSPQTLAWAQDQVTKGRFKSVDSAIAAIQGFRKQRIKGTEGYFEKARRVDLPEDMREWNPNVVLPGIIENGWLFIEGAREWGYSGTDFKTIKVDIEEIRDKRGKGDAIALDAYVKAQFGEANVSPEAVSISKALRSLQFMTKLAISPLTITRNIIDRLAKGLTLGTIGTNIRATLLFPPVINKFIAKSQAIQEEMVRNGAVLGHGTLSEGFALGGKVSQAIGRTFAESEKGNQTYIALVKKLQLEADIAALNNNKSTASLTGKMYDRILAVVGKSQGQRKARVLWDIPDETLVDRFVNESQIDPDVMAEVLHRTVTDSAFPLTLASKRLWWGNSPWMQVATQFKVWSADQMRFIYQDVLKYTIETKDPSRLARFMLGTFLAGELYNIARDLIANDRESLTMTLLDGEDRTMGEVGRSIANSLIDGGIVGMVGDLSYGIIDWLVGPTVSTIGNAAIGGIEAMIDPAGLPAATQKFLLKDVPALRQAQGVLDTIDRKYFEENNLTANYKKWRQRAFDFQKKKRRKTVGVVKEAITNAILGFEQAKPTTRSLSLSMIARQVLVGDTNDAAEYMKAIIENTPIEDLKNLKPSFMQSMRNNSPMGNMARADIPKFLAQFSQEGRDEIVELQTQWYKNYLGSLKIAGAELKAEGFFEELKKDVEILKEELKQEVKEIKEKLNVS